MEGKIKQLFAQIFDFSTENNCTDISMENVDKWDSLTHMELIVNIEEAFDVKFEPEEMIKMVTYHEIIGLLKEKGVLWISKEKTS